jgi:hypothetical protein
MTQLKSFQTERPAVLKPYRGRRIFAPTGHSDIEEAKNFKRAFTFVVSPSGDLLHLNRFFDRRWAPIETQCVRTLMAEVEPDLVSDLDESSRQEDRYHVSMRPPQSGVNQDEEEQIGRQIVATVCDSGVPIATDKDVLGGSMDVVGRSDSGDDEGEQGSSDPFYSRSVTGAYWVDPHLTSPPRNGEGRNAVDFAADEFGFAFTTEMGIMGRFEDRVEAAVVSVEAGIEAFDRIH